MIGELVANIWHGCCEVVELHEVWLRRVPDRTKMRCYNVLATIFGRLTVGRLEETT